MDDVTQQVLVWVILALFGSFVGVPGILSFLGMDETYWRLWLAGHMFLAMVLGLIVGIIAVYWALFTVIT